MKPRTRAARFVYKRESDLYGVVTWKVTATSQGVLISRSFDRRKLSLSWERILELAILYGSDGTVPPIQTRGRR